mmetsp:Transcript_11170/g.27028  ORF Transcript_11170/g.27028 Transcript_11170/m.27028 type:complete len:538 (-) Transcript_11170:556-2169(-)
MSTEESDETGPIKRFKGLHDYLSNFYPCSVTFEERTYPSVEHAFQAAKSMDEGDREHIASIKEPREAKRAGKKVQLRPDWGTARVDIMKQLLMAKFTSDKELTDRLVATGDRHLEEGNTWNDKFWGVCNGQGENKLGVLLMEVRSALRDGAGEGQAAAAAAGMPTNRQASEDKAAGQSEQKENGESSKDDKKAPSPPSYRPQGKSAAATGTGHDFVLEEVQRDLFKLDSTYALGHCVSRDLQMGKGIAKTFKERFGGVEELKSQDVGVGDVAVLHHQGRFLYYLVTKEKYHGKPTYDTLKDSLVSLKRLLIQHDTKKLGLPLIGCGLDKLEWPKVKQMIREVLGSLSLRITVCVKGDVSAASAADDDVEMTDGQGGEGGGGGNDEDTGGDGGAGSQRKRRWKVDQQANKGSGDEPKVKQKKQGSIDAPRPMGTPSPSGPAFSYEERKGDMFKLLDKTYSLVHCVAVNDNFSKGICQHFAKIKPSIQREVANQHPSVGKAIAVPRNDGDSGPPFLYNLITKVRREGGRTLWMGRDYAW